MSLRVRKGRIEILDQRALPLEEKWLPVQNLDEMYHYIKVLAVRGAPMIGCAAALSLAQWRCQNPYADLDTAVARMRTARPTAVNLMYCCDYITQQCKASNNYSAAHITQLAFDLIKREQQMCLSMARHGASLVLDGENILTHCNTGSLATIGMGTALGVIRQAHRMGKKIHVYVDETRPLLQGGRLTSYELSKENIPYTVICDNMAAHLMSQEKIQRVFVGADRIAMNGDFANKIGTYSLAIVSKYHQVPFHTVSPVSTIDFDCNSGRDICIEERDMNEVLGAFGTKWTPHGALGYNPAFDVTPIGLVTSMVLDSGVFTREEIQEGRLWDLKKPAHVDERTKI
ncbi:methylthioribose-1-phosphate isomerase-like [Schistocerca gregaria]|uniref:methylthioribose-1-phosphate isomerase-like n=1 Tax=Schistocerca gregaria TaxID=7010 RepID=UPI00211EA660|nr:methylthioribose-1-phosphate isomerase-like [Schistocerca gregaria]